MPGQVRPVTDERDLLLAFLAHQRAVLRIAGHGLTDEQLRAAPSASELSVGGLIKHCSSTERSWIDMVEQRSADGGLEERAKDYLANFRVRPDETLNDLVREFDEVAVETERVIWSIDDLNRPVPVPKGVPWFPQDLDAWSVRWVLLPDPLGKFEPQALLCTEPESDPLQVVRWFVRRWRVEVTYEEVRRHLGVETQRQWSDLAILRTTPALLGLFSLIALWADRIRAQRRLLPERVRWYPKADPTFSDALALVRRELWTAPTFATSRHDRDRAEIPAGLLNRLILVACQPP